MKHVKLNLPTKHCLDVKLVKSRKRLDAQPLLPDMGKVMRARRGSKTSRFFRHLFEHKNIKKLLGGNIALMIVATTIVPTKIDLGTEPVQTVSAIEVPLTTKVVVHYPVEEIKINQGYRFYHPGLDLDGITGDPIYPIMNGKVEAVQYVRQAGILSSAYGNAILIRHENSLESLYAHLSEINVEKDQEVTTKTIIGEMGSTGRSFGDHLHLEIRKDGFPVNPNTMLPLPN